MSLNLFGQQFHQLNVWQNFNLNGGASNWVVTSLISLILGEMVNFQKVSLPKSQIAKNINLSLLAILSLGWLFRKLTSEVCHVFQYQQPLYSHLILWPWSKCKIGIQVPYTKFLITSFMEGGLITQGRCWQLRRSRPRTYLELEAFNYWLMMTKYWPGESRHCCMNSM
jgi:hypothetical protein